MLFRIFKWVVYSGSALLFLGGAGVLYVFYDLTASVPQLPTELDDIFGQPTRIYGDDADGNPVLLHTLGGNQRVPLNQMSQEFKDAVIATEDAGFYEHEGIDKRGMIRALAANIRTGDPVGQGASTITQQLARHLFYTKEKQWMRKLREITASMQIETRYEKDAILSAYVNNVYYGADAYGVEEAAQRYFSKHANALTLGEAALLAGLLQAPSRYNPYYHMDRALARRKIVLNRMVRSHFITQEQARQAEAEEIVLKGTSIGPPQGPFFIDYVRDVMVEKYGSNLVYNGGLKIYTTMDIELQTIAEEAIRVRLAELDSLVGDPVYTTSSRTKQHDVLEAALVSIDANTGAVKALVGGRDYTNSEYNRAVQNLRQPGSGFKPFIYLSAIDRLGYSPGTLVVDEPISFITEVGDEWEPKNFSRWHRGPIILKWALMRSINVISAKLINEVGPEIVVDYAKRMGITSKLNPYLSLALGTNGIAPLEMASAYSVFSTGGIYYSPFVVKRVEDSEGKVIDEAIIRGERVVNAQSAYLMLDMLRGVILRGTGAGIPGRHGFTVPAGGKTGTSSESMDVWFNGFTREMATSVWAGYDDSRPVKPTMGGEATGASGAIPIWAQYMKAATDTLTSRIEKSREKPLTEEEAEEAYLKRFEFPIPIGIEFTRLDIHTGGPPANPDSVLAVATRGAIPKVAISAEVEGSTEGITGRP